jgi:hypothetical protein
LTDPAFGREAWTMATDPHAATFQALVDTITGPEGELKTAIRHCLFEGNEPPENMARFVETVTKYAYKVTDSMVEELKAAGYSEDQIFEASAVVAVRSAAIRLEANERAMEAAG